MSKRRSLRGKYTLQSGEAALCGHRLLLGLAQKGHQAGTGIIFKIIAKKCTFPRMAIGLFNGIIFPFASFVFAASWATQKGALFFAWANTWMGRRQQEEEAKQFQAMLSVLHKGPRFMGFACGA